MKTKKRLRDLEAEELDRYDEETDSENEALQEAFAKGILKPGLNFPVTQRKLENNVPLLREKLDDIRLDLPWVEKLDVISPLAPLAPELSVQIKESESNPVVHDDLKRESIFYRQAQNAVLQVLPKLRSLGIPTQRPDDYLAEMAKTDAHMQKVKVALIKEKAETERVEKVRAMRAQKKLQKALNAEAKVKKVNAKKELMDQVKKFRKGETKDLSFLDGKKPKGGAGGPKTKKAAGKKKYKDGKFGFGGKKRDGKRNTRESTSGYDKPKHGKKPPNKRPGKSVRKNMKGKKK
uniref:Putative rRNA-processing protein EBP2 n=2 Tax=Lygus hesperus TaxID=30085 RepID=A0A0A9W640_LYGHE